MSKQTVSNEYVSAFCLEMSLLLHAGIGIEDGLYLLIEDEKDKKSKKMLEQLADLVTEGKPFSEAVREVGTFPKYVGDMIETGYIDDFDVSNFSCAACQGAADFQSGL